MQIKQGRTAPIVVISHARLSRVQSGSSRIACKTKQSDIGKGARSKLRVERTEKLKTEADGVLFL
eukprot:17167-Heterococcus_DN1.PRE.2